MAKQFGVCCLLVLLAATTGAGIAVTETTPDESKKLTVTFSGVEKAELRNIQSLLDIWQFDGEDVPSLARLRFLHRKATEQIQEALRPFGYYRSTVNSQLRNEDGQWKAIYDIEPGDRIKIKQAKISVQGPGEQEEDFVTAIESAGITADAVLDQQAYEALKQSLQSTASRLGYFDAEFLQNEIQIDLASYSANVALIYETGARYKLGEVTLTQDVDWLSQELLSRFNDLEHLQYFDARDLQGLQSGLSSTEYYSEVQVSASAEDAKDLVIPVKVKLTHKNPRQFVYGVGFETDSGVRLKYGITGRRLNKNGHHYAAQVRATPIGFRLAGAYTIPTRDPRTDSFGFSSTYEREDSDVRKFNALGLGANFSFRDGLWFKSYALTYQVDQFTEDGDETTTVLLMPSMEWARTWPQDLNERINAVNGSWLRFRLRGGSDSVLSDTSFVQPTFSYKWIKTRDNGHRLIGRGSIGATWVEDFDQFPVSLRYYAGGDVSVRGYGFEKIGPSGSDGRIAGGRHLIESSIEYEIPLKDQWSVAAFVDAGDAFDNEPEIRIGVGFGVRWQSPIGPIRIDLGRSLDSPGRGNVHLHFSLGPDL
ncbi:hypothetical protein AB833_24585 [Chromatiales bacterium (ex Bugula neritina AB1)]|nr:hypothetical protein AB833_24585 [Chromatiales bacterium (ex Bugula neritina AB1)]